MTRFMNGVWSILLDILSNFALKMGNHDSRNQLVQPRGLVFSLPKFHSRVSLRT